MVSMSLKFHKWIILSGLSSVHDESNHWVISTDYKHYAIVNYCSKIADDKFADALWVFSPQHQLDSNTKMIVEEIIEKYFVKEQIISVEQGDLKCGQHWKNLNNNQ